MSGHSKWANIRFRKAAQDAKRGKIFTKLIRESDIKFVNNFAAKGIVKVMNQATLVYVLQLLLH